MRFTTSIHPTPFLVSLFITAVGFNSPVANAAGMPDGNWYLKVHGGAGWNSEGNNRTIDYGEDDFDVFSNDSGREVAFQYGVGAGFNFHTAQQGSMGVGIGWYGDVEHEYKGFIDQYGRNSLRDYSYSYKVQTQRVILEGSWDFPFYQQLEGFVTAGLGMSWNKFSSYKYTPLGSDSSPKPQLQDNTKTGFAWQLGAGVSWAFMPQWRASVFYLYANNGKAESTANNTPVAGKYETDDLTSHNLMFSLNYQF